jgi:hypothetical protein
MPERTTYHAARFPVRQLRQGEPLLEHAHRIEGRPVAGVREYVGKPGTGWGSIDANEWRSDDAKPGDQAEAENEVRIVYDHHGFVKTVQSPQQIAPNHHGLQVETCGLAQMVF